MKSPLVAMYGTFAIFSVAFSFSNLFINIYIWKKHTNLFSVAWFQLHSFVLVFIGFLLGAFLIRVWGSRINYLVSSLFALVLYIYLYGFQIDTLTQIGFVGALNGIYIGLFYAGLNFYSIWFSEKRNLSQVISLQYMINGVAQMITPLLAGWTIHTYGYNMAFLLAIAILLLQTVLSTATPQVRIRSEFRRKGFFVPANRQILMVGMSAAAFGFFFAFVHMSVGVFVYLFVKDEWVLGEWNTLFALLSVATYYWVGKKLSQSSYEWLGTLGVVVSTVVSLTLFFPYPASFVVFNAIISVFLPIMWVPAYTNHFATIRREVARSNANPLAKMMEFLVFREFSLCAGRILFLLILIGSLWWKHDDYLFLVLILLCFMPTALFLLSQKAGHE